jgi:peptidyl-prolyl cis-trans isomerase D
MLRGIHKASSGWIGKSIMAVVMGLLVISFAIWGIGDIFRGFGQSNLAEIGDTTIGIEQFRNYYNDRLSRLGRQMRRSITPDQARALGIDRQILSQLVAETVLDQQAKRMHLGVSDAEVAKSITDEPAFQGVNGKFDRARFEQAIRDAGFTEQRFVQEQRAVTLRRQIALTLTGDLKPPLAAQNSVNTFRNEKRTVDLVALGPEQAGEIAAPTPEALQKYFDERKALFRAPETRKVTLLAMTPADIARWEVVSDDDARTYYEQRKADFGTPEKRHLHQIVFDDPEKAKAASDKITAGASFEDILKDSGVSDADSDLGVVAKSAVIDPAVADAAFALQNGETSKPIKGRFGTVLVKVSEIEPGEQQTYEEAAAQIKGSIALDRARRKLGDLRDKIEDERAAGSTLAETAKKLGLTATSIEAIDRSGRDAAGNPVHGLPQGVDIINAVFTTDVGIDTEALQIPAGGWVWYDVTGINPSRDRSFDEVKAQVETMWRDSEIASRLKAKADDMLAKLKAGEQLAGVAQADGLKVDTVTDIQRGQPKEPVSGAALDEIFRTAKGQAGASEGDKATTRLVFVVTEVVDPPLDAKSAAAIQTAETLKNGYGEDILGEYVAQLETELGVNINQAALQQVIGGSNSR